MRNKTHSWVLRRLVLAGFLLASGCSSLNGRSRSQFYPGVYPGLHYRQADYFDGTEGRAPVRPGWEDPYYDKETVERRLGAVIDFPFTIALDTVLLPWDIIYWMFKKRQE